jgi:hypothetical protein
MLDPAPHRPVRQRYTRATARPKPFQADGKVIRWPKNEGIVAIPQRRFLHGAACHGCLLIAETSCEQGNDFLDRTLVVLTVDNPSAAFFPDPP